MAAIKLIRQYNFVTPTSILYDVVYQSGRSYLYEGRKNLPKSAEAFLRSAAKNDGMYDHVLKSITYIYQ